MAANMIRKLRDVFRPESSYRAFFLSIVTFALGYGLYKGIIDNYLAEVAGMSEFDKGVSEFFREIPGLLLILVLAILYSLSAERIYQIGALIMTAGLVMQAVISPSKVLIIAAIFIYSLGEHIQLGMRNTLTLEYAQEGKSGAALGRQNAVYQIGMVGGYLIVIALFYFLGNKTALFKPVFAASAAVVMLGYLASLKIRGDSKPDASKRRFYFHKKVYQVLYARTFLRSQEAGLLHLRTICAGALLWCERYGYQHTFHHFSCMLVFRVTAGWQNHRPLRV